MSEEKAMDSLSVGTPVLLPAQDEVGDYLVVYQRHWGGTSRAEKLTASLDGITEMLKKACEWGGMAFVYYPNPAGMLQLAYLHGEIEDLFR